MPFQANIAIEEGESALCALAKTPQMCCFFSDLELFVRHNQCNNYTWRAYVSG